ncbi:DDHD domain-containing protein [Phakopsora pachyrhizi]|nr:DDHD domain-containing protein [Phakopsora pachyrhizi]
MTQSQKPSLITHFLHVGPSLSDFNNNTITTIPSIINPVNPNQQQEAATPPPSITAQTTGRQLSSSSSSSSSTNQRPKVANPTGYLPTPILCSPFSNQENERLESAWQELSLGQRERAKWYSRRPDRKFSKRERERSHQKRSRESESSSKPGLVGVVVVDQKGKGKEENDQTTGQSRRLRSIPSLDQDEEEEEDMVLNLSAESLPHVVPVGLDSLFTVDVKRLKLFPAFWHGPRLDVYRGEWFYASNSKSKFYPCDPQLSESLETAYEHIRPWDLSYQDELRSALKIGTEAEDKLKVHLQRFDHDVIFQSSTQGRVYSTAVSSRISKTILTNFFASISRQASSYSGGTLVVRGWDQVLKFNGSLSDSQIPNDQDPPFEDRPIPISNPKPKATGKNTTADMIEEEEELENTSSEVSELVLVIHGIGQKLAQSYDSFDFVHACNQLRLGCNSVTKSDPKMKDLMKNKRVQFVPIRWRQSLEFDIEANEVEDHFLNNENETEPRTNKFSMKDIEIPNSITFVREVISNLVLDVPLYMSPRHHKSMICAVIQQANKVYKLFCHRNRYYSNRKVSIIAHSLGAALTVDILSNQPTSLKKDDSEADCSKSEGRLFGGDEIGKALDGSSNLFCFETRNVFLVGSPVAFFFHLHQAQLIAREGLVRSSDHYENKSEDEMVRFKRSSRVTSDEVGQYGCLASESVYNIYISTDPVAYSSSLEQVDASAFTKRFLDSIEESKKEKKKNLLKRIDLSNLMLTKKKSWFTSNHTKNDEENDEEKIDSMIEVGKVSGEVEGSSSKGLRSVGETEVTKVKSIADEENIRSIDKVKNLTDFVGVEGLSSCERERFFFFFRFEALNPIGCVDFVIPSLGLNQYVDMVTAHAGYWNENRFSKLILILLFGKYEDLKNCSC